MELKKQIELIDTMVKINQDYTIRDFIEMRGEIVKLINSKERESIILTQLKHGKDQGERSRGGGRI